MVPFEACKAKSGKAGADISTIDAYYIGMRLTIVPPDTEVTAYIIDANGKKLDYLHLILALHGNTRSHTIPKPVLATGGINVLLDDETATWIVYYAEQVLGHKHV